MEKGGQVDPGSVEGSDDNESGMTRRDFLKNAAKIAGVVALGGLTAEMLTGCDEIPWEQRPLGEMEAVEESEKKMLEVLKSYTEVKSQTGADSEQSAILTQPIVKGTSSENVARSFVEFKSSFSANSDESAILTSTTYDLGSSVESMGATYTEARNKAKSHNESPVNVAVIAAYTNESVDAVLSYEDTVKQSEKAELAPIMTLAALSEGKANDAQSMLSEIRSAGVKDEKDVATLLFARSFTNAPLSDLLTINKELDGIPEIKAGAKSDLLMAAVYNNLDLESVLEAYNFAGTLEGMTVESAAKLALAMFAAKVPTLGDSVQSHPYRGGGGVYIYHGGFYPGYSYGYYPRTSTAFVPTSRGASFSRPGVAPVRGGGTGTGISGGRGGVGGRGGSGSA